MVRLGDNLEALIVAFGDIAIEMETILAEKFRSNIVGLKIVVENLGTYLTEAVEIETIVVDSLLGTASLNFEVFEKIYDEIRDIHG